MIDPVSLGVVFEGVGTAKDIAKLFGLLESIDIKIDKLLQVELKAGISTLKAAANSESAGEQNIAGCKTLLPKGRIS